MGRLGDFLDGVGPAAKKLFGAVTSEFSTAMFDEFVEEMEVEIREALCVPANKPVVKPLKSLFRAYLERQDKETEPEGPDPEDGREEPEDGREGSEETPEEDIEEASEEEEI